jgi:cobalt-precorrin 5A hydrolase/precorrin-3B C17-methyltransferase
VRGRYRDPQPGALLCEKGSEPPVLAVAEDGSAVVPLLGGLGGVNVMAREIAEALGVAAAITTSGELRSALACSTRRRAMPWRTWSKASASSPTCWPVSRCASKVRLVAAGAVARQRAAQRTIMWASRRVGQRDELLIHPRSGWWRCRWQPARHARSLQQAGIAEPSVPACWRTRQPWPTAPCEAAQALGVPLRFASNPGDVASMVAAALPDAELIAHGESWSRWRLPRST